MNYTLATRLHTLHSQDITINLKTSPEQAKKAARLSFSLKSVGKNVGFLHAALVKIQNKYYIFAGPSGVGKTSYAKRLNAKILANDWVAVEKEKGRYYASDLNFPDELKHKQRCPLSGVIFLTRFDKLARDAFCPTASELHELLQLTFDTATANELKTLSLFWQDHAHSLPIVSIPTRQNTEDYTTVTIQRSLLRLVDKIKTYEVGVIGTGAIGTQLAIQLGQLPFVSKVHLYNRTVDKAKGIALDMNHAMPQHPQKFVAHDSPEDVFSQATSVFMTFRDSQVSNAPADWPERWLKLPAHLPITKEYVETISKTNFTGTLFIITNPVDILTYAFYSLSQRTANPLRTFQLYGVGLDVDVARALTYAQAFSSDLRSTDVSIFGNHADSFTLDLPLPSEQTAKVYAQTKGASKEIRQYTDRTIFGPVAAAIKNFTAFVQNDDSSLTTLQNNSYFGQRISFSNFLPTIDNTILSPEALVLLNENQETVAKHSHLL